MNQLFFSENPFVISQNQMICFNQFPYKVPINYLIENRNQALLKMSIFVLQGIKSVKRVCKDMRASIFLKKQFL